MASLLLVARFRARARRAGVGEVTIAGKNVRFAPVTLPDSRVVRLDRLYPKSIVKAPVQTILVPRPHVGGVLGKPLDGIALLQWAHGVIDAVIDPVRRLRRPDRWMNHRSPVTSCTFSADSTYGADRRQTSPVQPVTFDGAIHPDDSESYQQWPAPASCHRQSLPP